MTTLKRSHRLDKPAPRSAEWITYFQHAYQDIGKPFGHDPASFEQWREDVWRTLRDEVGIPGVKIVWELDDTEEGRSRLITIWQQSIINGLQ